MLEQRERGLATDSGTSDRRLAGASHEDAADATAESNAHSHTHESD